LSDLLLDADQDTGDANQRVEQTEETVLEDTLCVEAEDDHLKDVKGQEAEEVVSRNDGKVVQLR